MIDCKYKWPLFDTRRGLTTYVCLRHCCSVNDDICSQCPEIGGKTPKPPLEIDIKYPRRTDEEIQIVYQMCKECPMLGQDKVCQLMKGEAHPTDIVAQHPANHCPRNKW